MLFKSYSPVQSSKVDELCMVMLSQKCKFTCFQSNVCCSWGFMYLILYSTGRLASLTDPAKCSMQTT